MTAGSLAAAVFLAGCAGIDLTPAVPTPDQETEQLALGKVEVTELEGWNGENFADALPAFVRSCDAIEKKDPGKAVGSDPRMGTYADWIAICKDARLIRPGNQIEAKYFFESRFTVYAVADRIEREGLFTGYYEPELAGRWAPEAEYQIPIYSRPEDIISIDLGEFRNELAGTQLAGRLVDNKLVPYFSRAEINAGVLRGRELEVIWVADPVDAFFLHIQGSGRVRLPDDSYVRIGYAGRNGRRYTSIGRELVAMGAMALEDVTAPAIRDWLRANPAAGTQLMNRNESYVFFRVIEGEGPLGAQGVPLTPGRSLAIDRKFLPLGAPIWLDTTDPLSEDAPLRRLLVTQDTGSAIKGVVRGDVFWGFGETAARRAGLMKQRGGYFILLPKAAEPPSPTV
ncbi:MAG: murein transglycosylase A [Rhodospirillales bacterium]|nr:murein transglycosylase A [Rhodospirillales bacterium]MBO6787617.1 murein transglycosylase A [Rhodospirillales bacterium]